MPYPLYVAFIWHQHQPLYKSCETTTDLSASYRLPWVRLHGTKDYLDLVLILERYPKLHQTVNLVPSLILQLEDYAQGKALDPYLMLTLTPVEQLTGKQKQYIIERFFDANHRTLIHPHPRYRQLYEQRHENGVKWCLNNWQAQDYSDLLAWHNLAWIDPLFWQDPEIAHWLEQGKNFTMSDRQRMIAKQRAIISRILPQHRKMQESGQLEVITSPYTHPILPLLANSQAARVALPEITLPKTGFQWAEDIPRHLQKAWEIYCDRLGTTPKGLWPSEQSVSPEILPYVSKTGFQWLCSDEAVLGWTIKHYFHRDASGTINDPDLLYRPYRLQTAAGDLAIVFRDHRLSDLIGFSYCGMEPRKAALDLIGHLEGIARSLIEKQTDSVYLENPWLVTIALDGENCWEHYPQDGLPFLEALYQRLSEHPEIALVTVSEFLEKFPPTVSLPAGNLHSGSWIDGNFTTWIGDPVKNKAWDLLAQARGVLAAHPEATPENNPDAWESLYAAEGSDWFWWFGEGHSSEHDELFDQLFREHLISLYRCLNEPIPHELYQPLEDHTRKRDHRPESLIHPVIDGIGDEQDWERAGRMELGGGSGTMHQRTIVKRLFYGWDHLNFYLRFDFQPEKEIGQDLPTELHLFWYYPQIEKANSPAPIAQLPELEPLNYYFHHHLGINLASETSWLQKADSEHFWIAQPNHVEVSLNHCLEIAVPWTDLGIEPDTYLHLVALLAEQGEFRSHAPDRGLIILQMP